MNAEPVKRPIPLGSKQVLWWPSYDDQWQANIANLFNHIRDMDIGIAATQRPIVCVQAGGCSGAWPIALARVFRYVHTFEPEPVLYECMKRNIADRPEVEPRIITYNAALSAEEGRKCFKFNPSAGASRLYRHDDDLLDIKDLSWTATVSVRKIDSLGLDRCDAIFLDVEGGEPLALRGAERTIQLCQPIIYVEDKHKEHTPTQEVLRDFGYARLAKRSKDSVWTPPRVRFGT